MAGALRIELSETALVVSPGGAVTTRCTVYNASMIVDEYRIEVSGVDASWVEVPVKTSRIFPEAIETITLTFRPPRTAAVRAGDYEFTVTATSEDNPALQATGTGTLTIEPFVDFGLDLASPRQASGEVEGTYTLRLTNTGNAPLTIALDAKEETGELDFSFSEPSVEIAGNGTKDVTLIARPNQQSLGKAAVYQITIGAELTQVSGAPSSSAERKTVLVTFQTVPGAAEPPVLSPQSVELSGQRAQTELILRNKSAIPTEMSLQASDKARALAFEFVGGETVTVPAQDSLTIPIRITCLDRTLLSPAPAPTAFSVIATPIRPSGEPRTVQGELRLPGPADFRLRLEPEIVESTVNERVLLTIENVSGRSATFVVAAASKDTALEVNVGSQQVEIPANESVSVPVELRPKADTLAPSSGARPSGYSIRVAPVDSPAHANEVSGQYIFTPAAISIRLRRKEIEAVGEATFEIEIENGGRNPAAVALSAFDRGGLCSYAFEHPQVQVDGRGSTVVRLTVSPPKEHKADARWEFTVEAKPVNPPGAVVRDAGVLIYGSPRVTLALSPDERRGRRAKKFDLALTNPGSTPLTVKVTARDVSGGLGIQLDRDTVQLPPSKTAHVPIKITPWKRARGSGESALGFTAVATPVSPPGEPSTVEGRFVALPARSRWFYLGIAAVVVLALLFSPLYEQAFYAAGWKKNRTWIEVAVDGTRTTHQRSGKHTFPDDVKCVFERIVDGDGGKVIDLCFAQGPRPTSEDSTIIPDEVDDLQDLPAS